MHKKDARTMALYEAIPSLCLLGVTLLIELAGYVLRFQVGIWFSGYFLPVYSWLPFAWTHRHPLGPGAIGNAFVLLGVCLHLKIMGEQFMGAQKELQATTLIERLALNHPFVDGNKRTALIAGNTFLLINHWHVVYADEAEEQVYAQTIENLVAQKDFEAVVQWLQAHVQPLDDDNEEGDGEDAATPAAPTDK